jgi:hypothetical protein
MAFFRLVGARTRANLGLRGQQQRHEPERSRWNGRPTEPVYVCDLLAYVKSWRKCYCTNQTKQVHGPEIQSVSTILFTTYPSNLYVCNVFSIG